VSLSNSLRMIGAVYWTEEDTNMWWDKEEAVKLRSIGLDQEQLGYVIGRIAEHRQQADREGYARGMNSEAAKQDGQIVTDEIRDILARIAGFYMSKSHAESQAEVVQAAEREITALRLHNVRLSPDKKSVIISLSRPGLLIGKLGTNISALEKFLGLSVHIDERDNATDHILNSLPYCEDEY
jgi:hypothetical protein